MQHFNRRLATRLSLRVIILGVVLFLLSIGIMFYYGRESVRSEAMANATQTMEGVAQRIGNELHQVEVATEMLRKSVENHLDDPDFIVDDVRFTLLGNLNMIGCCVCFEPYYYKEKGELYMPYFYRTSVEKESWIFQSDHYGDRPYIQQDWYDECKKCDDAIWIKPMTCGSFSTQAYDLVISYSLPIHDRNGRFVGVCASDMSLDKFSQSILSVPTYPNSYCSLISRRGAFLIHPDSTMISKTDGFLQLLNHQSPSVVEFAKSVLAGEKGVKKVHFGEGDDRFVFYRPFKKIQWTVALSCPFDDILKDYDWKKSYMAVVLLVGILLLVFFFRLVIYRGLHPLYLLDDLIRRISAGHFNVPIQASLRHDEIGSLQNCFKMMQEALVDYVRRVELLSSDLTMQNEALRLAYEQEKAADLLKTNFLYNMTDKMDAPILAIEAIVKTIEENRQQLGNEAMKSLVEQIEVHSQTITRMLDELLEQSLNRESQPVSSNESSGA